MPALQLWVVLALSGPKLVRTTLACLGVTDPTTSQADDFTDFARFRFFALAAFEPTLGATRRPRRIGALGVNLGGLGFGPWWLATRWPQRIEPSAWSDAEATS